MRQLIRLFDDQPAGLRGKLFHIAAPFAQHQRFLAAAHQRVVVNQINRVDHDACRQRTLHHRIERRFRARVIPAVRDQ